MSGLEKQRREIKDRNARLLGCTATVSVLQLARIDEFKVC